jgi:hypothetical protein
VRVAILVNPSSKTLTVVASVRDRVGAGLAREPVRMRVRIFTPFVLACGAERAR